MVSKSSALERSGIEHRPHLLSGRGDYVVAASAVAATSFLFILAGEAVAHWFLLPLAACGILAGVDVVRWLRGRLDIYDPRTIIACLAFYGFFLAPLLHVLWDTFGAGYDLVLRGDRRPWLGTMGLLHAAGLGLYRLCHKLLYDRVRPTSRRWTIDDRRFLPVFGSAIAISLAAQIYLLAQMGGIGGVIDAYERNKAAFEGKGWLLAFAGPLTVLSFIVFIVWLTEGRHRTSSLWVRMTFLFSAVGIANFLLMGWRGSRAATVMSLLWMVGIVHFRLRKLPVRLVVAGMIVFIAFMYFYGFYKERGREGWEVLRSPKLWTDPQGYKRDIKGLLLGDLARADVTAFILYNLIQYPRDYDYRYGLTYAGAFAILVPKTIWAGRPEFKVEAGTEAQYGKSARWRSSRVYGLSGEALLNFGPLGVPLMFGLFGGLLGWYRRKVSAWQPDDSRFFMAPLLAMLFAVGFIGDSDNVVFAAVTHGTLVFAAIHFASNRQVEEKHA